MIEIDVEKRLFERNDTFSVVRLLAPEGDIEGVIEDFSIGGMGLRVDGIPPPLETDVTILFPNFGGLSAQVVRVKDNQVGLSFTDTPERIGELMHAVKNYNRFR